jgi:hypothetical protein
MANEILDKMYVNNPRAITEAGTTVNLGSLLVNSMGGTGFTVITNTAAHTAPAGKVFLGFFVQDNATIAAMTFPATYAGDTAIATQLFQIGMYVPMTFSSVTLTSGKIIAYFGYNINV